MRASIAGQPRALGWHSAGSDPLSEGNQEVLSTVCWFQQFRRNSFAFEPLFLFQLNPCAHVWVPQNPKEK